MGIVLGIFHTTTFKYLERRHVEYPFDSYEEDEEVIKTVKRACKKADTIQFSMDGIKLPLKEKIVGMPLYTCMELKLIINNKEFLKKTTFWLDLQKIDKEGVLEILSETELPMDNMNFSDLYKQNICKNIMHSTQLIKPLSGITY